MTYGVSSNALILNGGLIRAILIVTTNTFPAYHFPFIRDLKKKDNLIYPVIFLTALSLLSTSC